MSRSLLLSALVYGLLLAGIIALRGEIVALAIPFAIYLLYGFWNIPEALNLSVERSLSTDRADSNADVTVTLTVTNHGEDIDEILLLDLLPQHLKLRSGAPNHLIRLRKNQSYTIEYTVAGGRGAYIFETIHATGTDLLGLVSREQVIKSQKTLFVFPEVKRLRHIPIRPRKTRGFAGVIPGRVGGAGTEFFGVREYQFGDSPRMVNWHASARHEDLYSNEYQQERAADVGVVLDARVSTNHFHADLSMFDHAVAAAASLSDVFLAQGNRVGLLVYGSYLDWTFPGYGKVQRQRIMHALARAETGNSTVFAGLEHLSPRMFPPESQIVLVSSLTQDDLDILIELRGRGYQVMVVSPDSIRFERGALRPSPQVDTAARIIRLERNLLIRRLERAGIRVIEWDVSVPLDHAINPALTQTRRVL
jgi:uncharacterized protein (DUF58 family)